MSEQKQIKKYDFNKDFSFTKLSSLNKNKNKRKNKKTTFFALIGVIFNIIWVLSLLANPPIKPQDFIMLGALALLFTFLGRLFFSLTTSTTTELQSGGSIGGFVTSWILVQFYGNKEAIINVLGHNGSVNEFLQYFLVIVFIIWIILPTSFKGNQEIIFNLPPIVSYFLLNLWKIIVIILFILNIWNIQGFGFYLTTVLLIVCVIEIIGMYQRLFKIDITDIILDLQQIIFEIIRGPLISIKWVLLLLILVLLNYIHSDFFVLIVLGFSILMSIISFITFTSRLTIDSGLIQTKSNQAKTVVPQIFSDIKELKPDDMHKNYYQVVENFSIKKKTKTKKYKKGEILFKLPLKRTIESLSGIYIAKMSFKERGTQKENNKGKNDFQFKVISKFTPDEWEELQKNKNLIPMDSEVIINHLGFKDTDEFDKKMSAGLKQFSKFQDGIRDRIRGVPPTWDQGTIYDINNLPNGGLPISDDLKKELLGNGITKLEIIPGKDEFLFYVKKKQ